MVEVLSKAKVQSVKEIKRNAKIKRRNKLLIKLAIVIVILIVIAFLITNFVITNKSNYVDKSTGISFSSTDGFYVNDSFKILSKDQNMLLVFNIPYNDSNQISKIINDITYLQSVFTYFQKNTTLVINVMDNKRTTISCQSNLGDFNKSVTLNRNQCVNLLDTNKESFIIDFPNSSLNKSQVVSSVSEKLIYIKSKNKNDTATFLQRLQMSYSKYFNINNDRSGSLFQGKSKAEHITENNYLKYIFSYIHLNPVKLIEKKWEGSGIKNIEKIKEYLLKYKYSSYIDFVEKNRNESKILNISVFPNYFPSSKSTKEEITEWLKQEKKLLNP